MFLLKAMLSYSILYHVMLWYLILRHAIQYLYVLLQYVSCYVLLMASNELL